MIRSVELRSPVAAAKGRRARSDGAGVPESFKVLVKELQSLGLNVEVLTEDDVPVQLAEDAASDMLSELEGINLSGFEADERERL